MSQEYTAQNYDPLPVVLRKGSGIHVYDVNGTQYLDFLGGYSALSLGHCHPKLAKVMADQALVLTLCSRGIYSEALAKYSKYITELFCYDKVLPMNTGVEAGETAVKLARKWGYKVKGIAPNEAKVVFAEGNFWGRTIAACSASTDPLAYENYGPFVPGFETVPFGDVAALEGKLADCNVCAFMVEPIQGEAGIVVPPQHYLMEVRKLCSRYNVLLIADEVQCGLGRVGALAASWLYDVRPDVLLLGKALSGGLMPVSAVLADRDLLDVFEPNTHGSTFGGNPLACTVAQTVLQIIQDENLCENSTKMGEVLRQGLVAEMPKEVVAEVRGLGLFNGLVLHENFDSMEMCKELVKNGLVTRPAKSHVVRLAPPLTIGESDICQAVAAIKKTLAELPMKKQKEKEKRGHKAAPKCGKVGVQGRSYSTLPPSQYQGARRHHKGHPVRSPPKPDTPSKPARKHVSVETPEKDPMKNHERNVLSKGGNTATEDAVVTFGKGTMKVLGCRRKSYSNFLNDMKQLEMRDALTAQRPVESRPPKLGNKTRPAGKPREPQEDHSLAVKKPVRLQVPAVSEEDAQLVQVNSEMLPNWFNSLQDARGKNLSSVRLLYDRNNLKTYKKYFPSPRVEPLQAKSVTSFVDEFRPRGADTEAVSWQQNRLQLTQKISHLFLEADCYLKYLTRRKHDPAVANIQN